MAAFGFSVLMREWRRGMAFDPWHGSLYLSLSAVITLSAVDGETNLHPWIWSAQSSTLNSFWSTLAVAEIFLPSWQYLRRLIVSPGKKRQKQICENIILFADFCIEQASQSSRSSFVSCFCPNHTRALRLFKEVSLQRRPKMISLETSFRSPRCGQRNVQTSGFLK